jgi:hypothetical protein
MAEICLIYTTQVHVTVDLEEERVTRVVVDDEGAEISRNIAGIPETDNAEDEMADILAAQNIADTVESWPAWEFGF